MQNKVTLPLVLLLAFRIVSALADQIVTANGIGPVKIGMSVKEAERALKAKLKPLGADGNNSEECWLTERKDKVDPFIQYMVEFGKITRIDVFFDRDKTVPP